MRVLRFIVRNWPLKIGAVLLAVILYVGMVALQTTQLWPGTVAIGFVNQPADSYLIKPDTGASVSDIRYIAAPDVAVTRDSFRATVDLADVKVSESQDSLVNVELVAQDPRIQIIDYQPQQITVALDPKVDKQVTVQVDTGVVPSGLQPGTPVLSASTVDVVGAASIVRRVAYADAQVRIDASGLDVNQDVDLVARDATDAVVNNVQFSPTKRPRVDPGGQPASHRDRARQPDRRGLPGRRLLHLLHRREPVGRGGPWPGRRARPPQRARQHEVDIHRRGHRRRLRDRRPGPPERRHGRRFGSDPGGHPPEVAGLHSQRDRRHRARRSAIGSHLPPLDADRDRHARRRHRRPQRLRHVHSRRNRVGGGSRRRGPHRRHHGCRAARHQGRGDQPGSR